MHRLPRVWPVWQNRAMPMRLQRRAREALLRGDAAVAQAICAEWTV